jgi:predicted 2-oxoglutarate/Fe(II)-dependent dioxygenase YbiX/peroxiredoxin
VSARLLSPGEPAPWFGARSSVNPIFNFDTVGGRYVVLCLFGSTTDPVGGRIFAGLSRAEAFFDRAGAVLFGVSTDPADESRGLPPRPVLFWDTDRAVSRLFGDRPQTLVLDERLRVVARREFTDGPDAHVTAVLGVLAGLPAPGLPTPAAVQAPVLIVPRVFEPELCQTLIHYYEERGGEDSGFMRDVDGKTVGIIDYAHKRRRDQEIEDADLRKTCMHRIHDRLVPEIHKAFQFRATRMERYIVACYTAADGGHFRAHRDNTTKGTAHRRFAVSLVLNTGAFEGGFLRFPEFGPHLYAPPAGGAVVFSCSLLHEATPVTRGNRFVFLPFLYDDAAARVREENQKFLAAP